jgi:hypothetical protein
LPKKTVIKWHLTQRFRNLSRMFCPTTCWVNLQKPYKLPVAEGAFPDTIKKQTEQGGTRSSPLGDRAVSSRVANALAHIIHDGS